MCEIFLLGLVYKGKPREVSINKMGQETTVVPGDPRGAFTSGLF